jgi:hypothetical protein
LIAKRVAEEADAAAAVEKQAVLNRKNQLVSRFGQAVGSSSTDNSTAVKFDGPEVRIRKTIYIQRGAKGYGFNLSRVNDLPCVKAVDPAGPAAAAGATAGDPILEVNGSSTRACTHDRVVEFMKQTPQGKPLMLVINARANTTLVDASAAAAATRLAGSNANKSLHTSYGSPAPEVVRSTTFERTINRAPPTSTPSVSAFRDKFVTAVESRGSVEQAWIKKTELNLGMYVEVTVWTMRNEAAGEKFVSVMQSIVDDDRQAEAYFQVFALPSTCPLGARPGVSGSAGALERQYLVVAVGSCDQFVELHQMYDIRANINGFSGHLKSKSTGQDNVKRHASHFYCLKSSSKIKSIASAWNQDKAYFVDVVETVQATCGGGWAAVSKFVESLGDDMIVVVSKFVAAHEEEVEGIVDALESVREAYAVANGGKSAPIDIITVTQEFVDTVGLYSAETWSDAIMTASAADDAFNHKLEGSQSYCAAVLRSGAAKVQPGDKTLARVILQHANKSGGAPLCALQGLL